MSRKLGPSDLLEYDERYRVLICRSCNYAVQTSALQSHLLKHRIYRGEKKQLLVEIAILELPEPEEVQLPPPTSAPIEALPIIDGYRCTAMACGSLYASEKRMRRHWSEAHGQKQLLGDLSAFFHAATLQTFFRGTKTRYFEVSALEGNDHHTEMDDTPDMDDVIHLAKDVNEVRRAVKDANGHDEEEEVNVISKDVDEEMDIAAGVNEATHIATGVNEEEHAAKEVNGHDDKEIGANDANEEMHVTTDMNGHDTHVNEIMRHVAVEIGTGGEERKHTELEESLLPASSELNSIDTALAHSQADFDLVTLSHFHHFITNTSLKLPSLDKSYRYWHNGGIKLALRLPWLMSGLFALTLQHMILRGDSTAYEHSMQYTAIFSHGFSAILTLNQQQRTAEEEHIRFAGSEIRCILFCARLAATDSGGESSNAIHLALLNHFRTIAIYPQTSTSDRDKSKYSTDFKRMARSWIYDVEIASGCVLVPNNRANTSFHEKLSELPRRLAEVLGKPESFLDVHNTLVAVAMLEECFIISEAYNDIHIAWRSMIYWALKVPDHFLSMLSSNEPAALVVLAYWTVSLLLRAEQQGCWFLKGVPKLVFGEICSRLATANGVFLSLLQNLTQ